MAAIAIVTSLALTQLLFFALAVGKARERCGLKAPACSGNEEFERYNRVHLNTLEQLVIVLPSMWIFAFYTHVWIAAALGLIFVASRFAYFSSYVKDPSSRGKGFMPGFIAMAALLLGGLGGAIWSMV